MQTRVQQAQRTFATKVSQAHPADELQEYKYFHLPHASGVLWRQTLNHELSVDSTETMLKLQDTDYCWRIQTCRHKLHFPPDAVVYHACADKVEDLYDQARLWGVQCPRNTDH